MSTKTLNYVRTLLKYSVLGFVGGVVIVTVVSIIIGGPSALFSNKSTWLGTEKQWARAMLWFLVVRGALCGLGIGLVAGLIRIVIASRPGSND
jgi:hypothetical protein